MDVSIRQVILADLDALVPLFDAYRQFYGKTSDFSSAKNFLKDRFEHGQSVILMAWLNQSPVGFTQLYPSFSSVSMKRVFVLNDLYVAPQGRRDGVGQALLKAAMQYAKQFDATRLSLTTDVQNLAAQALYEVSGWKRDQQFYSYHLYLE